MFSLITSLSRSLLYIAVLKLISSKFNVSLKSFILLSVDALLVLIVLIVVPRLTSNAVTWSIVGVPINTKLPPIVKFPDISTSSDSILIYPELFDSILFKYILKLFKKTVVYKKLLLIFLLTYFRYLLY